MQVNITVENNTVHQMRGGIGASWHSILHPPVGHGGSAFGGNPPVLPRHEQLWQSIERHATWLGINFIRLEFEWTQFEPSEGVYTFDSPEMRILDRICQWAQRTGAEVMIQQQWGNVAWNTFDEYVGDPAEEIYSAPKDLHAFARGWVALVQEFLVNRKYSCVKWVNLINEPGWWWWHIPGSLADRANPDVLAAQMEYLAEASRIVESALINAGLDIRIMGPDETDMPIYDKLSNEPWYAHVRDVDFHCYNSVYDWDDIEKYHGGSYFAGGRFAKLSEYRSETSRDNKGLFITEFGSLIYSYGSDNPSPGRYNSSFKDVENVVRMLAIGVDGLSKWSFTNRGDVDGQFQLIDTWDRGVKSWLPEAVPHDAAYHTLGLAMRHIPLHARILKTTIDGGLIDGIQRLFVVACRSPRDGSLTTIVVNDSDESAACSLAAPFTGDRRSQIVCTQQSAEAQRIDQTDLTVEGTLTVELPAMAFAVITDTPLDPDGAGRF